MCFKFFKLNRVIMGKIYILTLFFVSFFISSFAQSIDWINTINGPQDESVCSICTDYQDNLYVVGTKGNPCMIGNIIYQSEGMNIVKYDSSGNVLWVYNGPVVSPVAAATDLSGNVIVTGAFSDTIVFGVDTLVCPPYTTKTFVVKYSSSGNVVWVRDFGNSSGMMFTPELTLPSQIYISSNDQVYVCGRVSLYNPEQNDNNRALGGDEVTKWDNNAFVVQFDSSGNFISNFGDMNNHSGFVDIKSDINNNCYLVENVYSNSLIKKVDSNWTTIWTAAPITTNNFLITSIVNKDADLYFTGNFSGTVTFGNFSISTNTLNRNIFLAKMDTSGTVLSLMNISDSTSYSRGAKLISDNAGNLYLKGTFINQLIFNNAVVQSTSAGVDEFIAKLNLNYSMEWIHHFANPSNIYYYPLCVGINDDIFTAGNYDISIAIEPNAPLFHSGLNDVYVSRFLNSAVTNVSEYSELVNDMTIYPNPAKDNVIINYRSKSSNATFQILNMLGEVVATGELEKNNAVNTIAVDGWTKGVYAVRVMGEGTSVSRKFVKE